ncbi:hypothetical protein ACE1SV_04420 [Streptomyces sennicomposti]
MREVQLAGFDAGFPRDFVTGPRVPDPAASRFQADAGWIPPRRGLDSGSERGACSTATNAAGTPKEPRHVRVGPPGDRQGMPEWKRPPRPLTTVTIRSTR